MGGSFNVLGSAYRRCPVAESHEQRKAADYRARVIGRRVVVTADPDFGATGTIVDVRDGQLVVRLDAFPDTPYHFARAELEAA